jgi:hypothetical protein
MPDRMLNYCLQEPTVQYNRHYYDDPVFRHQSTFAKSISYPTSGAQTALPTNRNVMSHVLRKDSVVAVPPATQKAGRRIIGTSYMFCDMVGCYWTVALGYEPAWGCQWLMKLVGDKPIHVSHITYVISKADMKRGELMWFLKTSAVDLVCLCGRSCLQPNEYAELPAVQIYCLAPLGTLQCFARNFHDVFNSPIGYKVLVGGGDDPAIMKMFVNTTGEYDPWPFFATDTPNRDAFLSEDSRKLLPRRCNDQCVVDSSQDTDSIRLCPETCHNSTQPVPRSRWLSLAW